MKKNYQISIVVLLLAALLFFAFIPSEKSKSDASDWMADLPDDRPLSALAIPGTHDSGALYSIADVAGKCQSLSVAEQLKAGVRFLDIRLQLRGERLAVVHSFVDQLTDFADVLADMTEFLQEHPSEFLIVSIKQDADAINAKTVFADAVEALLSAYPDVICCDSELPQTVSAARGKMYILARYDDAGIGIPAYDGWQDNTAFALNGMYVQDRYAIADIAEKQAGITDALAVAREQSHALVLNYTSCYLTHGFPPSYAATPAKTILPWLQTRLTEDPAVSGVIICDFMTSALCEQIWRCNFR